MLRKIRKAPAKQEPETILHDVMAIFKSALIAVILTLICFTLFAVIIKIADLQEDVIPPVVQVVRILSAAIGGILASRASKKMGWIKGGITGILYILCALLISYVFGGSAFMGSLILSDILLGFVAGSIGGIIGVNLRN